MNEGLAERKRRVRYRLFNIAGLFTLLMIKAILGLGDLFLVVILAFVVGIYLWEKWSREQRQVAKESGTDPRSR